MILHPGILALLGGSTLSLMVLLAAGAMALQILRCWDIRSTSAAQLRLERRTWLVSSLLNFVLGFQALSLVLFVFTAEDIHPLFVGAMCATGALNANLVGWLVLLIKGGLLFFAAFWVAFNRLDQQTEDLPLIRPKYLLVLLLTPLVGLDLSLQWAYFRGLQPGVITSCCGALFSAQGDSVAGDLAGLPVLQSMTLFFTLATVQLALLGACLWKPWRLLRTGLFCVSVPMFFASLIGIVSFISLYIYQMPSHRCPFDMLQAGYGYVGYPLYLGLFMAAFYGMLPGMAQPLQRHDSLRRVILRQEPSWLRRSLFGMLLFLAIVAWPMVFGSFRLLGY